MIAPTIPRSAPASFRIAGKCFFCGKETPIYTGLPICVGCSHRLDAGKKLPTPTDRERCADCGHLADDCERLKGLHKTAQEELRIVTEGALPVSEYRKAQATANKAWLEMQLCLVELERHFRGHRTLK